MVLRQLAIISVCIVSALLMSGFTQPSGGPLPPEGLFGVKIGAKADAVKRLPNKKPKNGLYSTIGHFVDVPMLNEDLDEYAVDFSERDTVASITGVVRNDCYKRYISLRNALEKKYGVAGECSKDKDHKVDYWWNGALWLSLSYIEKGKECATGLSLTAFDQFAKTDERQNVDPNAKINSGRGL